MITMGLVVFMIFGAISYLSLPLNLFPELNIPYVTVQTVYPGAGPVEIETQITKKIEDGIATISKIENITSYSMENVSFVIVKFEMGKNADIATQEIKDKINVLLNELPNDAQLPVVEKFDLNAKPVIDIVLSGSLDAKELYDLADTKLKDRLSQIEGVARVNLTGGIKREIKVETDNRTVFQNVISVPQMAQILAAENMDMPAGHFMYNGQEYSVRLKGQFASVDEIKNVKIPTPFGNKKLAQVASVYDAGEEVRERTVYFDNLKKLRQDNVVLMSVIKTSDGNTVAMAKGIKEILPELERELPSGCNLNIVTDKSIFIESSVEDTLMNIILGVILTGLVLLFFLHDFRSTLIVALAMPFSIISTFLFMQLSDFSMNIMTLMGLSTAVGILVTNSVVVLENIFRHKELGHNRIEAAGKGTAEITVAVIASTMTNIVVFLPIASMSSIVGQFFKEFALTVTYATVFSLITSFTLTPMLASLILPEKDKKKHPLGKKLEAMFKKWDNIYQNILTSMLKNKKRSWGTILISIFMFFLSFWAAARVGFEFMPAMDEGDISIEVELPQGYSLQQTAELVNTIEEKIKSHQEVKHILTSLGSLSQMDKGTNVAKIAVKLVDSDLRSLSNSMAASLFINELSDIPNARIRVAAMDPGDNEEAPVTFYLQGQEIDHLEQYKTFLVEKLKKIDGLINVNTSSRPGKPEITVIPNRNKLADAGLNIYSLALTLRASLEGMITTTYKEDGNEYDIRVSLQDQSVNTPEKIRNLTVVSPRGVFTLSRLADVYFTEGYSKILHKDKYKAIEITGYIAPGYALGDVVAKIKQETSSLDLPAGYRVDWGGDAKMMEETTADMLNTFILAMILTYMLLAAILEDLLQPLMILGTVPLALIGVFFSLFITGKTMNMMSMMAIIMLLGIVVNNAILLLDYTNILRKKGKTVKEALIEACPTKLKPILMATVAIIFGMLPMALGIGSAGVEFRQPMGIVSIGGLIVSTFLTLLVIPSIYYLTVRDKKKVPAESRV